MNLNIDIHNFSLVNINFLDTKKNIIMDGNFTKIIYSNQWFTVNSIFIHFPIEWISIDKIANKYILRFNPYSTKNLPIVQDFAKLETRILEYFKMFFNLNVRIVNSFSKQLYTGNMKIFKEYTGDYSRIIKPLDDYPYKSYSSNHFAPITSENVGSSILQPSEDVEFPAELRSISSKSSKVDDIKKCFVIKISGIWENYEEIGLTFKLMDEGNPLFS